MENILDLTQVEEKQVIHEEKPKKIDAFKFLRNETNQVGHINQQMMNLKVSSN